MFASYYIYVAATRGRESLTVITSDREQLREAIGISGERMSAVELAQKAGQQSAGMGEPRPGLNLGLNLGTAVELARSQAVWQESVGAAEELERRERQRLEQELEQKQERRQSYGIGYGI
jgi:ATP-dependent exoDNAse (exonuclease V) alpha subunit